MLFEPPTTHATSEDAWLVCTSRKWAIADKDAVKELYNRYTRERVHGVLRDYASALAAGAVLPELKNPRSLLWGWVELNRELAKCVEPSAQALRIALAADKSTMARIIELGLRARERWHVAAHLSQLHKPTTPLTAALLVHYCQSMPPIADYVCLWLRRTEEPWSPRHPWHMLDGAHIALEHVGDRNVWLSLMHHVERHLAG